MQLLSKQDYINRYINANPDVTEERIRNAETTEQGAPSWRVKLEETEDATGKPKVSQCTRVFKSRDAALKCVLAQEHRRALGRLKRGVFEKAIMRNKAEIKAAPGRKTKKAGTCNKTTEKRRNPLGDKTEGKALPKGITWQPYNDNTRSGAYQVSLTLKGTMAAGRVQRACTVTGDKTEDVARREAWAIWRDMQKNPDKYLAEKEENQRAKHKYKEKIL